MWRLPSAATFGSIRTYSDKPARALGIGRWVYREGPFKGRTNIQATLC